MIRIRIFEFVILGRHFVVSGCVRAVTVITYRFEEIIQIRTGPHITYLMGFHTLAPSHAAQIAPLRTERELYLPMRSFLETSL